MRLSLSFPHIFRKIPLRKAVYGRCFLLQKRTLIRCIPLLRFFVRLPQNLLFADKAVVFNVKTPGLVLILFGIINSDPRTGNKRITAFAGTDPDGVSAKVDAVMFAAGNSQRLTEFSGAGSQVGRIFAFAPGASSFPARTPVPASGSERRWRFLPARPPR